jgi:hypothetical protein
LFPHLSFRLFFSCNLLSSSPCSSVLFTFLYFVNSLCFFIYFVYITYSSLFSIRHRSITNHTYAHTRQKRVTYKAYEYSPTFMHLAGLKPASKFINVSRFILFP